MGVANNSIRDWLQVVPRCWIVDSFGCGDGETMMNAMTFNLSTRSVFAALVLGATSSAIGSIGDAYAQPVSEVYSSQTVVSPAYEYVRPQAVRPQATPTSTIGSTNGPGHPTGLSQSGVRSTSDSLPAVPIAPAPVNNLPDATPRSRPPLSIRSAQLQAGTEMTVAIVGKRQVHRNDAVTALDVIVQAPVFDNGDRLVIPAGTVIRGQLQPRPDGAQFVGTLAILNDRAYNIRASSYFITDRRDPRQSTPRVVALDAGIGAAAGSTLSAIFTGGVTALPVVGGTLLGVATGQAVAPHRIVLREEEPFGLVLESPLVLSQ